MAKYSLSDEVLSSSGSGMESSSGGSSLSMYVLVLLILVLLSGINIVLRTRSDTPIMMMSNYDEKPKTHLKDDELSIDELIDEVTLEAELID